MLASFAGSSMPFGMVVSVGLLVMAALLISLSRGFIQRRGHKDVNDSGLWVDIARIGFKCHSSWKE